MTAFQDVTTKELYQHTKETYRQGGGSRPEVRVVVFNGQEYILKDYARCDPMFGRLLGGFLARREARALQRLHDAPFVPNLIARIDKALLIEHVSTRRNITDYPAGELPKKIIKRLSDVIISMHRFFGIAHCDLRSPGNILIDNEGHPHLVDFTAHYKQGRLWNPLSRWLFRRFCDADLVCIARLKKRNAPELLNDAERNALQKDRKTITEKVARMFGKSVRNLSRWFLTRRKNNP